MEVIVRFKHNKDRDTVLGSVGKLSDCINEQGRPTAGVRIQVLAHLQASFRSLFKYGQMLRARYGQGTRRHIKFDDTNQSLFLNAKLPGDESWSQVSLDVARRGLKAREVLTDEEMERRLDITGPLAPRPHSASLTGGAGQSMETR